MYCTEGVCWTRTAERQASRMRMEYLRSVLRQEVGFFDNKDASSTTFNVVSTMSMDAHLIQDVVAEKVLLLFVFLIFCANIFPGFETISKSIYLLFADTELSGSSCIIDLRHTSCLPIIMATSISLFAICNWICCSRCRIREINDEFGYEG